MSFMMFPKVEEMHKNVTTEMMKFLTISVQLYSVYKVSRVNAYKLNKYLNPAPRIKF